MYKRQTYEAIPSGSVSQFDRRFGTLRLGTMRAGAQTAASDAAGAQDSLTELKRAATGGSLTKADAVALVIDALADKTATIFNSNAADIDPSRTLSSYGVDSLVAVELRNWLASSLKAKVSIFDILQSPSITEFSVMLMEKSELLAGLE